MRILTYLTVSLFILLHFQLCQTKASRVEMVSGQTNACAYIPIQAERQCIDLTGSEFNGGTRWQHLFDESLTPCQENEVKTDPMPQFGHTSFFPANFGLQVVIDLEAEYQLESIWYYPRSFEADTLWIYSGDYANKKLIQTCFIDGKPANWGWKKMSLNLQTRWVTLQFRTQNAAIAELRLFGQKKGTENTQRLTNQVNKKLYTDNKLSQFVGVNAYSLDVPDSILRVFGHLRMYHVLTYWENYLKILGNHTKDDGIQQFIDYSKSTDSKQKARIWASVRGNSTELQAASRSIQYPPVNGKSDYLYEIKNYTKHGRIFYQMAQTRKGQPGVWWENGNEEDGYWRTHYWSPFQYFLVSMADWDGFEGQLGENIGIKNGDKNSRLMMSGLSTLDTARVRALDFLCKAYRKDQQFIWQGGVQYHHYSNNSSLGKNASQSVTPEQDQMRLKLAAVADFHRRVIGSGVPLILGENGYDRNPASWQAAPAMPGQRTAEAQGIMTIRSLMACFFSGFDQYSYFMLQNAGAEEDPPGVFGSSGMISGPGGKQIVYPVWYYWKHVFDALGSFKPDQIIRETGKIWVYRMRSTLKSNQYVYYLVNAVDNETVSFSFSTPFKTARQARMIPWCFTPQSNPGSAQSTIIPMQEGQIQVAVGPKPVFLLVE
jgi:hypothetical protein